MVLAKYVDCWKTLPYYGFNYCEPSVNCIASKGRMYTAYIGYYHDILEDKHIQLIIGECEDSRGRTEWYFTFIPNMSQEEMQGLKQKEFEDILDNMFVRKNRVAGRDLLTKLEEATRDVCPF